MMPGPDGRIGARHPRTSGLVARIMGTAPSFQRFFWANVVGVTFDIGLATVLHRAGLDLSVAVAASLLLTASLLYVVHEKWTFRDEGRADASPLSLARFSGVIASSAFVYVVRIACLWVTGEALRLGADLLPLQLAFAAGVSLVPNVLVTRSVFAASRNG